MINFFGILIAVMMIIILFMIILMFLWMELKVRGVKCGHFCGVAPELRDCKEKEREREENVEGRLQMIVVMVGLEWNNVVSFV